MKKNYKKNLSKNLWKINLLEDLKKVLLNFSFIIIYAIHKILVLIKNHLNYFKDNIFKYFFKKYNKILFSKKKNGKFKSWKRKHDYRYNKSF